VQAIIYGTAFRKCLSYLTDFTEIGEISVNRNNEFGSGMLLFSQSEDF